MAIDLTQPIPEQSTIRALRGARRHPIDLESTENMERAVDVRTHGIAGENYYYKEGGNPPYEHRAPGAIPELYVREGILAKLLRINETLAPLSLELYLFDAYRPPEVQNYFHAEWVPSWLRARYPDWSDEEVVSEVGKYWAKGATSVDAIDPLSPPPHATGAVVDLTLRRRGTGELLNMGGPFDEVSAISFPDHFERKAGEMSLTPEEEEARTNRRILYHAMTGEGFVVHPNEWWHFSVGDQLAHFHSGNSAPAVYSVLYLS